MRDPLVRVPHRSLVVAIGLARATAEALERGHRAAGYAVLAIVAIRLVRGFLGSRHARLSDFVRPPREVPACARGLLPGAAPRPLGHNPIGDRMILALLAALFRHRRLGPAGAGGGGRARARLGGGTRGRRQRSLVLIGPLVLGVLAESRRGGENLVRAMITGRKAPVSDA